VDYLLLVPLVERVTITSVGRASCQLVGVFRRVSVEDDVARGTNRKARIEIGLDDEGLQILASVRHNKIEVLVNTLRKRTGGGCEELEFLRSLIKDLVREVVGLVNRGISKVLSRNNDDEVSVVSVTLEEASLEGKDAKALVFLGNGTTLIDRNLVTASKVEITIVVSEVHSTAGSRVGTKLQD
jgi:hypothetical protein